MCTISHQPEFQCSSASRKFLNSRVSSPSTPRSRCFSALQRAENSSIGAGAAGADAAGAFQCSSASRKFLNVRRGRVGDPFSAFQCSSASRKFLNRRRDTDQRLNRQRFSALQRAENSSIRYLYDKYRRERMFQCSSASRKFLNLHCRSVRIRQSRRFQCSSASRKFLNSSPILSKIFFSSKFQCSSASRKFLNPDPRTCVHPYFRPR